MIHSMLGCCDGWKAWGGGSWGAFLVSVHSLFTLLRVLRGMVLPLTGLTVLPNLHTLLTYLVDNVTTNSAVLPCLALGMPRTRLCLGRQVD